MSPTIIPTKGMHELFTCIEGCMQMAPRVDLQTRDSDGTLFTTLGRIASHCFVVTGVFPIFVSQASVHSALLPSEPIPESILICSFLNYIDNFERAATEAS